MDGLADRPFDTVVTTCDEAWEAVEGPEADRLAAFRQVRDGLRGRIQAELAGGRTS